MKGDKIVCKRCRKVISVQKMRRHKKKRCGVKGSSKRKNWWDSLSLFDLSMLMRRQRLWVD